MKIVTAYAPPPIPDRNYDWTAIDDDTYDGAEDSPTRYQIGYGRSKEAAIADLMLQLDELRADPLEGIDAYGGKEQWG